MIATVNQPTEFDEFSMFRAFAVLWRHKIIVAVAALIGLLLGIAAALTSTKQYRAAVVAVSSPTQTSGFNLSSVSGQMGGLAAIAGINLDSDHTDTQVAIARLKSTGFLAEYIDQNNLMPILFASAWDASAGRWKDSWFGGPPDIDDAVRLLRERILTVTEDRRSGIITVAAVWKDRELAAKWANELVARVNAVNRDIAIQESRRSRAFLTAELTKTTVVELREAINRLVETQLKMEMIASVRAQYSLMVVDPARAPAADSFVKPRRAILIGFGVFVGLGGGILLALVRNIVITRKRD